MDMKFLNQIFELRWEDQWIIRKPNRLGWSGGSRRSLSPEIEKCLDDHKVQYIIHDTGTDGLLRIFDPKLAMLFKLTWM